MPEQPFRTKWGSIGKNWKNGDFTCAGATLSHEMSIDRQKLKKIAILLVPEQPFRTKWWSIVKNWGKIAILLVPEHLCKSVCV